VSESEGRRRRRFFFANGSKRQASFFRSILRGVFSPAFVPLSLSLSLLTKLTDDSGDDVDLPCVPHCFYVCWEKVYMEVRTSKSRMRERERARRAIGNPAAIHPPFFLSLSFISLLPLLGASPASRGRAPRREPGTTSGADPAAGLARATRRRPREASSLSVFFLPRRMLSSRVLSRVPSVVAWERRGCKLLLSLVGAIELSLSLSLSLNDERKREEEE